MSRSAPPSPPRRARARAAGPLAGVLLVVPLLAGCSGGDEAPAAVQVTAATSDPTARAAAPAVELDLGLLPASAFGAGAMVTPLSDEQLQRGADLAGALDGVQITPATCAAAVRGTQPQVGDFADIAAQTAVSGSVTTVELLAAGGPEGVVEQLAGTAATCPQAQVSSPAIGTATVTFTAVAVPQWGDGSAAVAYTTEVQRPDGSRASVPALVGLVRDGDRLLTLLRTDATGGALDPAAFTGLMAEAYRAQAVLG